MNRCVLVFAFTAFTLLPTPQFGGTAGLPPFEYVDVSLDRGIGPYRWAEADLSQQRGTRWGGGVVAADFDDDGDTDIFVPTDRGLADQLYRNLGGGRFEEIAEQAGLASLAANRVALWFDYDGDRDLDLIVGNDESDAVTLRPLRESAYTLYRQYEGAKFEDVTVEAGLSIPLGMPGPVFEGPANFPSSRTGIVAGDVNNDGYLDVFAPTWASKNHFFLNNGDGTFSDISESSGVGLECETVHQGLFLDFDRDGWLDLLVSEDFEPNKLWINQGDLTFREVAGSAGLATEVNDMGITVGDPDNDGDLDIYITGIYSGRIFPDRETHSVLFRNDSDFASGQILFKEISEELRVDDTGWGWGTTFTDGDNDGWQDIAATNGYNVLAFRDRSAFFWNDGGAELSFSRVSDAVNFHDDFWGSALVTFDFDGDGDLDLLQSTWNDQLRLLENRPREGQKHGNYLVVKPRMDGANHRSIGAVVSVKVNGLSLTRLIHAGTSYLSQEPAEAFFGIGLAGFVDSVTVRWPDGSAITLEEVEANQVLEVRSVPGGLRVPGDCSQDGQTDFSDAVCLLVGLFIDGSSIYPCGDSGGEESPGDVNLLDWQGDGLVDLGDAILLLTYLFIGGEPHRFAVPGEELTGCRETPGCPSLETRVCGH